jgi:hypothetical protein
MTAPATQKRIIFAGTYLDLFNALQAAREQQDNERVTDALMERRADDRQAVDETPFTDGFSLPGYDYLNGVPADPTDMYQKGWVCNSRRAAIKQAYERQLHQEYNALFTDRRDANK